MALGPPRDISTCIVTYHHIQELKCPRVNMVIGLSRDMYTCIVTFHHIQELKCPIVKVSKGKYGNGPS